MEGCKTFPYVTWEKERENEKDKKEEVCCSGSKLCCLFNQSHAELLCQTPVKLTVAKQRPDPECPCAVEIQPG